LLRARQHRVQRDSRNPRAAGSAGNVLYERTFTGGIGATGYTVGQIVAALKALGLIAA
jgi:hypothetical protein